MMKDWAGTQNILASQSGTISTAGLLPSSPHRISWKEMEVKKLCSVLAFSVHRLCSAVSGFTELGAV